MSPSLGMLATRFVVPLLSLVTIPRAVEAQAVCLVLHKHSRIFGSLARTYSAQSSASNAPLRRKRGLKFLEVEGVIPIDVGPRDYVLNLFLRRIYDPVL